MPNTLSEFLTVACASTGQATFYNTRQDQQKLLADTHAALLQQDRRIYALSGALPITDKSRQLILENLLQTGAHCTDSVLESHVIQMVADDMQFNRILNLFVELREKKVNNARTRRFGALIWAMVDEYRAIKYRSKIRTVLRHCHIPEGTDPARAELHNWIFGANTKRGRPELTPNHIKHNPKLKSRLLASTVYDELFALPLDIARDIAVNEHKKDATEFEREFVGRTSSGGKGKATRKETMRVRKHASDTVIDFEKFTIFDLLMHGYRQPADKAAVNEVIERKAKAIAEQLNLPDKVALVIDNSTSALGSADRQFQPLAMMGAIVAVCKQATDVECFYVGPTPTDCFMDANGDTNLRLPFARALQSRPDLVMVLSDGYENVRAGSISQIMNTTAFQQSGIVVMHLNPIAAIEGTAKTRNLSDRIMSFAIASPDQLPMVTMICLASQNPELLRPMFNEIEHHVRLGHYREARLATKLAGLPVQEISNVA